MMAAAGVFHSMENFFAVFPRYGKIFSTLWKKEVVFSTQWKNVSRYFHTMERMFPRRGKLGFRAVFGGYQVRQGARGCCPMAVERSTRRPLSIVECADRGARKTVPDEGGQRPQPQPPRVRRRVRAVFLVPRSGIVALSDAMGALGASVDQ